jgi:hypothetical protein
LPPAPSVTFEEEAGIYPLNAGPTGTIAVTTSSGNEGIDRYGSAPDGTQIHLVSLAKQHGAVLIRASTAADADKLIGSIDVYKEDSNGCPDFLTDPKSFPQPAAVRPSAWVSSKLALARVCRYQAGWIEQSGALRAEEASQFAALLNGLPQGFSSAPADQIYSPDLCKPAHSLGELTGVSAVDSEQYLITLIATDGKQQTLAARLSLCGSLGVTDGVHAGQRTPRLIEQLTAVAGNSQGAP